MAVDYYKMGYSAQLAGGMTPAQVKQQHPLFRAGFNAAAKQAEIRSQTIQEVRVQKVDHKVEVEYDLQWKDIMSVLSFHPWNVLHRKPELNILHTAIARSVDKRKNEIKRYGDIIDMVRQYWELMLEHGYAEGILNVTDLKQYNYVPKALRA